MKKKRRRTLSYKLNLLMAAVILVVAVGLVWISYRVYSDKINAIYIEQVERAARGANDELQSDLVRHLWDGINNDEFRAVREKALAAGDEEMIRNWMLSRPGWLYDLQESRGENISEEASLRWTLYYDYDMLFSILEEFTKLFDISAIYLQMDENGLSYNLVDPAKDLFYVGSVEKPITALQVYGHNEYVPPTIYRSNKGWLCTTTLPLDNTEDGKVGGTVGVDTDMNMVVRTQRMFLVNCAVFVILLTTAAMGVGMLVMHRMAVDPLQKLSEAAKEFADDNDGLTMDDVISLPMETDDEIGDLYQQIRSMEERIVKYTDNITHITAERERVNTELNMAERIQRSMLPPDFPDRPEFDLSAAMQPAREVGGDFYDFFMLDDTHLAVLIADVSDKGVPAALFMMSSMIMIRYRSKKGGTPAEILTEVNGQICGSNRLKMFVTVWMGIIDLTTGTMTCTNAGHEYPFIRGTGGSFRLLKDKHGLVIGGLARTVYQDYELKLEPGDAVFVYTDGVTEANNKAEEMFGMDRLEASLNSAPKATPQEILERVKADVDAFAGGAKQFDDLTMLCLEYKGPAAA